MGGGPGYIIPSKVSNSDNSQPDEPAAMVKNFVLTHWKALVIVAAVFGFIYGLRKKANRNRTAKARAAKAAKRKRK